MHLFGVYLDRFPVGAGAGFSFDSIVKSQMKQFFIKYHKKIDIYCMTVFLYCLIARILLGFTSFIEIEELRAAVALVIPVFLLNRSLIMKILKLTHHVFKMEE